MWDTIISIAGALLSLGGLIFSILAWREAGSAKTAANKAAQGVKRQSIAMDIAEICQKCQIGLDISYEDVMKKHIEVNDGISRILGLYSQAEIVDENCKKILDNDIVNSLKDIKIQLNALNPGKQQTSENRSQVVEKFYYYQFSELFSTLSGNLNKLKGALEKQLTINI